MYDLHRTAVQTKKTVAVYFTAQGIHGLHNKGVQYKVMAVIERRSMLI